MNKRIRYIKTDVPGQYISTREFTGTDGSYKVYLEGSNYTIILATSGQIIHEGTATSAASAKLKAKSLLEELGVAFEAETRTKTEVLAASA